MAKKKAQREKAKDTVLPHSQAKLDLYKNYLANYVKILTLSPFFSKINLFDIYCGMGIYKDGKFGSPIITNDVIRENNKVVQGLGKSTKPILVCINDFKLDR